MDSQKLLTIAKETAEGWVNDNAFRLSAALAFYTIFSIAPLLVILVAVAGIAFGPEAARHHLSWQFEQIIGRAGAETVEQMLAQANQPRAGMIATTLSLATLIIGATAVFTELQDALNAIWRVKPRPGRTLRKLIRDRFFSFILVVSLGLLLLVSLVVSAALSALGTVATRILPPTLSSTTLVVLHTAVSFAVTAGLFGLMFKVLPDVRLRWREVLIGGVFTAALFAIGRALIGLYLGHAGLGSPFGAAGSLVVLLVWIYYSSMILYLGAEFTRAYVRACGLRVEPSHLAMYTDAPASPTS